MMDCDTVDGEPEIRLEVTTWDNRKPQNFCAHQLVQDFWTINSTTPRDCLGLDGGIIARSWRAASLPARKIQEESILQN